MRRPGFGAMLVVLVTAMVGIAVLAVGWLGLALVRRAAEQQALAEAVVAADGAAQALDRATERLVTSARLLAGRPTLTRLLRDGDRDAARRFLESFRTTGELDGCAVLESGTITVAAGTLPGPGGGERSGDGAGLAPTVDGDDLLLTAWSPIAGEPRRFAVAVRRIDETYVLRLQTIVRARVALATRAAIERHGAGERGALHLEVLERGGVDSAVLAPSGDVVAVRALEDGRGGRVGIVETVLDASVVAGPVRRLAVKLSLFASGVAVLLAAFAGPVARRLAAPIATLTRAAERIGRGDLSTPIPRVGGGEIGALAATMEEMRERIERLTSEIRRRQAEAEAILAGVAEGVFSVDRERRVRYMNPQAAAMIGIDPESAAGRFCGDVLRPRPEGGVRPCEDRCPILHARYRGASRATERIASGDGGFRTVVITSAPPTEEPGGEPEAPSQIQVLRDETGLEAARRMRDAVLAHVSHEFRTPLSAQLASLELLRDRLPGLPPEETLELVRSLERGALRLTRLVDNLLESTRIEGGELTLRRSSVRLDEIVEDAVASTAPLIEQRRQRLDIDLPFPMPAIVADGPRLVQVLVNLLANANKYAPADTRIGVGAAVEPGAVRLWVEDEGPGLPQGSEHKMFERFVRATDAEPEQSGMGLGLFIVESIVERHGGRVATSREDGRFRVTFSLPTELDDEDSGR